nr:TolC family protein [Terriglobales bacterium]
IQDTAVTYAELSKWQNLITHLQQEQAGAAKMQEVVEQRIQAGVDNTLDRSKAQLASARVRYRLAEAKGAIDLLRKHLSLLTGLTPEAIDAEPTSIPALPEVRQEDDLASKAVHESPTIEAAQERARAQLLRARAEHKAMWPEVDFATQYALLSNFNNYLEFYNSFQRNNASIGVAVRFPFLNFSQRAHANIADADAVKASNDANAAKNKVSEETLRLQRAVEQLAAAQQVADLQTQISNANFDALKVKVNSGTGTLHDLQAARDDADAQFDALQDANFQLTKTRIALLRSTGELQSWIDQSR